MKYSADDSTVLLTYCFIGGVIFFFFFTAFFSNSQWSELSDAWEHAATIRELSSDFLNPQHPYYSTPGLTTPRYTGYIFIVALLSRLCTIDAINILNIFGCLNYIVLLWGIYVFFPYYTKNRWSSVFAILVLICFWGDSWYYSNVYSFKNLPVSLFFPSTVSFSLCFFAWFFYLRWLRESNRRGLVFFLLLSTASFNIHPVTGSLLYLFAACLLADKGIQIKKGVGAIALSVILLVSFSAFWPYGNFFKNIISGLSNQGWYHPILLDALFSDIPACAGFAFLGIPLNVWILKKREFYAIPTALLCCILLSIYARITDFGLLGRYVIFSILFCHFGTIIFLTDLWNNRPHRAYVKSTQVLKTVSIVTIIFALVFQVHLFNKRVSFSCLFQSIKSFTLNPCNDPHEKYAVISTAIQVGDVVLSDPLTSWVIPAMSGAKVLVPYRNIPFNEKRREQLNDVKQFFSPATPVKEKRKIIEKYNISHIVWNTTMLKEQRKVLELFDLFIPSWDNDLIATITHLSRRVIENKDLIIFEIERTEAVVPLNTAFSPTEGVSLECSTKGDGFYHLISML